MKHLNFLDENQGSEKGPSLIFKKDNYDASWITQNTYEIAEYLKSLECGAGCRVGIMLGNEPLFICSLLAVWSIKATAVLLSTYFRETEITNALVNTDIRILISRSDDKYIEKSLIGFKPAYAASDDAGKKIQIWKKKGMKESWGYIPEALIPATIQFTSGVSGRSKAVVRTYSAVQSEVQRYARTIDASPADIFICPVPCFHAYGLVDAMLCALHANATLILIEKFVPGPFINIVNNNAPTIMTCVPFMYELLNEAFYDKPINFSSLRYCFSAGAKLSESTAIRFKNRFGMDIHPLYGSSETGTIAFDRFTSGNGIEGFIGHPVTETYISIVDKSGNELNANQTGEIVVESESNMIGYLHKNKLVVPATLVGGKYHTGDIGYKNDQGHLYIVGRKSTFINVAGMKVDPVEVEQVLNKDPRIRESAVVGIVSHRSGEKVKAFVVPKAFGSVTSFEVKATCKDQLAEYKIPSEIEFIDEIPRNSTGKILRKYLTIKDAKHDRIE